MIPYIEYSLINNVKKDEGKKETRKNEIEKQKKETRWKKDKSCFFLICFIDAMDTTKPNAE